MSQGLNTRNKLYPKHGSVSIQLFYFVLGVFSSISPKIRLPLYFIGIFCIKHEYIHSKFCQCLDQEFHLFNCKYSISGTIQHKTVSFKADMLLILKFILFHMMYGIIKCPVIMRYFPTDDMNLVFSFIDQYFWSVLKFNKQFYVLVETVIFSQQYFSTFFNSIIFFLIR